MPIFFSTILIYGLTFGLIFTLGVRIQDRFASSQFRITFFDVGQGDGMLLQFPSGGTMLVDAGDKTGEELYLELTRRAILTLDIIVVTHPDQDHAAGFLYLMQHLSVKELWINADFLEDFPRKELTQSLISQSELRNVQLIAFKDRGERILGGVPIHIYPIHHIEKRTNNRPLILEILPYGRRILLTADIESWTEQQLLSLIKGGIDLLKVAHHGSKTSSIPEWTNHLHPQMAVLSCGLQNSYGHPHPATLETFQKLQIPLLRTDFHGAVEVLVSPNGRMGFRTTLH